MYVHDKYIDIGILLNELILMPPATNYSAVYRALCCKQIVVFRIKWFNYNYYPYDKQHNKPRESALKPLGSDM